MRGESSTCPNVKLFFADLLEADARNAPNMFLISRCSYKIVLIFFNKIIPYDTNIASPLLLSRERGWSFCTMSECSNATGWIIIINTNIEKRTGTVFVMINNLKTMNGLKHKVSISNGDLFCPKQC